jgi:preprotein translocase subunit SecE
MNIFQKIRIFSGELGNELKRVTWPTRAELKKSTIVVIVSIVLLGIYVGIVDFALFQVVSLFTHLVR